MRGFALTATYDLDLATLCVDSPQIAASALALTFRTWRNEWPGNLRLGMDPALVGLKAPDSDIKLTLLSEAQYLTQDFPGLTVDVVDVVRATASRRWRVRVDAYEQGRALTYEGILAL